MIQSHWQACSGKSPRWRDAESDAQKCMSRYCICQRSGTLAATPSGRHFPRAGNEDGVGVLPILFRQSRVPDSLRFRADQTIGSRSVPAFRPSQNRAVRNLSSREVSRWIWECQSFSAYGKKYTVNQNQSTLRIS